MIPFSSNFKKKNLKYKNEHENFSFHQWKHTFNASISGKIQLK